VSKHRAEDAFIHHGDTEDTEKGSIESSANLRALRVSVVNFRDSYFFSAMPTFLFTNCSV
jgi:hypothetical protein